MSKRERFLAIAVAVVIGLFAVQYVFNRVTTTLTEKQDKIDAAIAEIETEDLKVLKGNIASRKLTRLQAMSLPSDEQTAKAQYWDWLQRLGQDVEMDNIYVITPEGPVTSTTAYDAYNFSLRGFCRTDRVFELLGKFYDKDYLHTIRSFKTGMTKEANVIEVVLDAQVLALRKVPSDQEPSSDSSGRLAMDIEEYKTRILNRNPFAPPNQPPELTSRPDEIYVGRDWQFDLQARDAEGHRVNYKLLSDELPEGLRFRGNSISWTPSATGTWELLVEAFDDGWPSASSEHKLVLRVQEPPKEEPKVEPPKFDIASQAFVTGLTGGRDGRKIWIRSRTDGQSFQLNEGSEFELGNIKAKVLSINLEEDFAELETDGVRWTVDMDTSLAEAFAKGRID